MNALTLHAMDESLVLALRKYAAELGTSLNLAAKSLLANALGVSTADGRKTPGFMKFAGRLSSKEAEGMRASVNEADFSKVDEADWK